MTDPKGTLLSLKINFDGTVETQLVMENVTTLQDLL